MHKHKHLVFLALKLSTMQQNSWEFSQRFTSSSYSSLNSQPSILKQKWGAGYKSLPKICSLHLQLALTQETSHNLIYHSFSSLWCHKRFSYKFFHICCSTPATCKAQQGISSILISFWILKHLTLPLEVLRQNVKYIEILSELIFIPASPLLCTNCSETHAGECNLIRPAELYYICKKQRWKRYNPHGWSSVLGCG